MSSTFVKYAALIFACCCHNLGWCQHHEIMHYKYGDVILLKEESSKEILVFSGICDPVQYNDKAVFSFRRFASIEELFKVYQALSGAKRGAAPELQQVPKASITFRDGSEDQVALGRRFTWHSANPMQCVLDIFQISDRILVAKFSDIRKYEIDGSWKFVPIAAHNWTLDRESRILELFEEQRMLPDQRFFPDANKLDLRNRWIEQQKGRKGPRNEGDNGVR